MPIDRLSNGPSQATFIPGLAPLFASSSVSSDTYYLYTLLVDGGGRKAAAGPFGG